MRTIPISVTRPAEPLVSVVIPARDEAPNLEIVLPGLASSYDVVVVDGHSVDGTADVVRRTRPAARVIQQPGIGKGDALLCGFRAAAGHIIVTFDADGSADPAEIPRFVTVLQGGADFAKGTRFKIGSDIRGGSDDLTPVRRLGNAALSASFNLLFRTRFSDLCYGFNAFWRDTLPALDVLDRPVLRADRKTRRGAGFEIEALLSCRAVLADLSIVEIPSLERERIYGQSHLRTFVDGARVLRTLITEHRDARRHGRTTLSRRPDQATPDDGIKNSFDSTLATEGPLS